MVKQLGSWSLVVVVVGRNLPCLGFGLVGMEKKMRGQGLAWKLDREWVGVDDGPLQASCPVS